jgi:hypothetical protein
MSLDLHVVGALMLLVLPPVAALCVLLTRPLADAIGRRQREEAQVLRAPVLVAGVALLLEALLAAALWRTPDIRRELGVALGGSVLWLDRYTVGSVLALSVAMLLGLGGAEAVRLPDRKPSILELAAALLLWAAHVGLALSGSLHTAAGALVVCGLAVTAALLLAGSREARLARLAMIGLAIAGPIVGWLLLASLRHVPAVADFDDAQEALRALDPRLVHAAVGRLWVAGLAFPAAAMLLLALSPRQRREGYALAPTLVAVLLTGALPGLLRVTLLAFPSGSPTYALEWLAPRLAAASIIAGLLAAGAAQLRCGPWVRISLVAFGLACTITCAAAAFTSDGVRATLLQAGVAGVLLPFCLLAGAAADRGPLSPLHAVSPALYDAGWVLLVPACLPLAWPAAVGTHGLGGYAVGGTLLALAVTAAWLRLQAQLLTDRPRALPGAPPLGAPPHRSAGLALIAALIAVALLVGALLMGGVGSLSFPIR